MRNPIDVLKLLTEKASVKEYQFKRLYRNLYNPDFYLLAYKNIATSPGSMTAGADGMTIDNMSMARINRIISALKDQTYQPNPARRTYIAKKNNPAKKRPLGIPSTDDKLVQEIIRMLLEAVYEPTFSDRSHGFRPKRSCHTALSQIKDTFTGVRWMVEGDIKACFDCFDHHVLIGILRRRIKDEMFLSLMWKFLKAGYMEQWEYHKTYSGTPQGSGMSPILANIYLSELDTFMEEYKARFDTEPFKRNASKEHEKIARRYRRAKKKLDAGNPSKEDIQEFKAAQKLKLSTPYADVLDSNFKRIQYNRYADDFVVGVIGSKQDALSIKEDLRQFLAEKLHLTLSEEKTKVTHSSEAVRYLGYDIRVVREKSARRDKNGALKRPWYGKVFLYVPHEKWENKLHELRVMQVKWDKNRGRDFWRPMHRNELLNSTDIEIIRQYNSEIRGLYNFYRIAENVGVLSKFYYMMRYSMLKTYAGKYRTNVSKIKRKYMHSGVFRVPYITKSGPKQCEFYHDGFRKHDEGFDNVQDTLPRYIRYDGRNTLANRLKAGICELCGEKTDDIRMHHVRALKKTYRRDRSGTPDALHAPEVTGAVPVLLHNYTCSRTVMVIALGAGYAETCKSGSGGGSAETAGESQYGAAGSTSHLMQMHSSYVVTDPKGTILVECGKMLQRGAPKLDKDGKPMKDKHGKVIYEPYRIKVLNTINFSKSMHYNPFAYARHEVA